MARAAKKSEGAKPESKRRGKSQTDEVNMSASAGTTTDDETGQDTESEAGGGSDAGHVQSQDRQADTAQEAASGTDEHPRGGRSVIDRSRYSYVSHKDMKTASGRAAVDNDDEIAGALRGLTVEQTREAFEASGQEFKAGWSKLNPGMQRMTMGNILRRLFKAGQPVVIPSSELTLQGPVPEPKEKPKRTRKKAEKPAAAVETEPQLGFIGDATV